MCKKSRQELAHDKILIFKVKFGLKKVKLSISVELVISGVAVTDGMSQSLME